MSSYYNDGRGRSSAQRKKNNSSNHSSGGGNRTQRRKQQKKKSPIGVLILLVLLVIGLVSGCNYIKSQGLLQDETQKQQEMRAQQQAEDALLDQSEIYQGVKINGVELGGMTREEAVAAVESAMGAQQHTMTIAYGENTYNVALLAGSNLNEVVEQAYNVGREGTREERLAAIEKLKTDNVEFTVEAGYSLPDLTDTLSSMAAGVNTAPVNATATGFDAQTESFTFADGKPGVEVDAEATKAALQAQLDAGALDATVQLVVKETQPALTADDLRGQFKMLATFTTKTTSNSNRNTNIRLCSSAISGAVVQPGEEFSINTLTGKRSAEKGYKDATVIKNGVYIEEPGGGVCQVSTTVFNAVVRAGLNITERYNHTIPSSYCNLGEDAAIDYPNKDFKFVNNSTGPVAVVMSFDEKNRKLTSTIYGVPVLEEGVELDLYSELTETIPVPEPKYQEDPTLLYGEEIEITSGLEGKKVTTYLITKKNGEQVSKTELHKSHYPKRAPVISINSLANPADAPQIPEEGGIPSEGGEYIPEDNNVYEEGDFYIPEE